MQTLAPSRKKSYEEAPGANGQSVWVPAKSQKKLVMHMTVLILLVVTTRFLCKPLGRYVFWMCFEEVDTWTENLGSLALESTALPARRETSHDFLVHELSSPMCFTMDVKDNT